MRRNHAVRGGLSIVFGALLCGTVLVGISKSQAPAGRGPGGYRPQSNRKQLLVWCDTRYGGGYHESVSHAMAVIERLGRESGLYDAQLRTDSQLITKQPISVEADGRNWSVPRNLNTFDAIFFYGMREIELTAQQKADLLSFVHDDGKGFVAAHAADTAFMNWPEFGEMMGARFDNHPWNMVDGSIIVEDPSFPAMKHLPHILNLRDEMYQAKDFSRDDIRVLMRLDTSKMDMNNPNVHRTDGDFPQAWAKTYGKGRVFYCSLGHDISMWDNPDLQKMWLEAIKWSLKLSDADVTPRHLPASGSN